MIGGSVMTHGRAVSVRRCLAAAATAFIVQQPMLASASRSVPLERLVDSCTVAIRLSVILDLALVLALVQLAVRTNQLVRALSEKHWVRKAGRSLVGVAWAAAAFDLCEDLVLWRRVDLASGATACPSLAVDIGQIPVSALKFVLWGVSLLLLLGTALVLLWRRRGTPDPVDLAAAPLEATPLKGSVICCSGGGIRSASFCLGALQELTARTVYGRAARVYGVSGGGYMAAAFHVLRTGDEHRPAVPPHAGGESPEVFSAASPELARLRRDTRYLASSPQVVLLALFSLIFGLLVNLVLVAVLLRLTAWVLGWLLWDAQALRGFETGDASVTYTDRWEWVEQLPWLLALVGVPLAIEKVCDRFRAFGHGLRKAARWASFFVACTFAVLATLLLGVPYALAGLHDAAVTNRPTEAVAGAVHQLGFASDDACRAAGSEARQRALATRATTYGSCGSTQAVSEAPPSFERSERAPAAGLLAVLVAVMGVVRTGRGNGGTSGQGRSWLIATAGKVWSKLSRQVIPWIAAALVLLTATFVLLRWTSDLARIAALRQQWSSLVWILVAVTAVKVLTDANSTSLHGFYRERLSRAYLMRRHSAREAHNVPYHVPLRWDATAPLDSGPELVLCAAANVGDAQWIPTDRGCTPFAFGHKSIGMTDGTLPRGGAQPPALAYEYAADWRLRDATVPAAMAISGAAVSPLTGRASAKSRPYRLVLALANARLGVWLPNPYWVQTVDVAHRLVRLEHPQAGRVAVGLGAADSKALKQRLSGPEAGWLAHQFDQGQVPKFLLTAEGEVPAPSRVLTWAPGARVWLRRRGRMIWGAFDKPGAFRLFKEAFGNASLTDRKIYVTDGGHYDNLGLVEALRSRPRHIVVLDASADLVDTFGTLGEAIATARMDLQVDITFDPRRMRKTPPDRAKAAWGSGQARHPDGAITELYLVKAALTDDLPWDIETYLGRHTAFPTTSTGDQLYGEWDFEAYRSLGRHLTSRLFEDETVTFPSGWVTGPLPPEPANERVIYLDGARSRGRDHDQDPAR